MAGTRSPEETMTIATAAAADEQAAAARRAVVETDGEFNFSERFSCFVSQRSVACDARADTCPEKFRGRFPGTVIETTEAETTGSSHFACGDLHASGCRRCCCRGRGGDRRDDYRRDDRRDDR